MRRGLGRKLAIAPAHDGTVPLAHARGFGPSRRGRIAGWSTRVVRADRTACRGFLRGVDRAPATLHASCLRRSRRADVDIDVSEMYQSVACWPVLDRAVASGERAVCPAQRRQGSTQPYGAARSDVFGKQMVPSTSATSYIARRPGRRATRGGRVRSSSQTLTSLGSKRRRLPHFRYGIRRSETSRRTCRTLTPR
jgi:hypothetical protein